MVTECHLVRKLLSALDTSRSLNQNTVASLNSYRSRMWVKLVFCTLWRSDICIAHGRRDDIKTRYSKNCKSTCLLFCQYTVFRLLFLTIFGPKPYYFVFSNVGRSGVALPIIFLSVLSWRKFWCLRTCPGHLCFLCQSIFSTTAARFQLFQFGTGSVDWASKKQNSAIWLMFLLWAARDIQTVASCLLTYNNDSIDQRTD